MSSKLHKRVKELISKILPGVVIKEEVNVKKLFSDYRSNREFYDLVIPNLKIIIECHGRQHEDIATFGGISADNAQTKLALQKYRDRAKEEVAIENNWNYVIVWYNSLSSKDQVAKEQLLNLIEEAITME